MAAEADEPRKRRRYTAAERVEILKAVDKVGVVEGARRHGVPQTTVSNWLHRDAAKVTKETAALEIAEREGAATVGRRKGRGATTTAARETAVLQATAASRAATSVSKAVAAPTPKAVASKVARKAAVTEATVAEGASAATALRGRARKRVARSYTPSQKAEALEHAAAHGVSAASDKFGISRFSLYDWQRKLAKAAVGEGPSPTSGPEPKTIEEQRDREILGEWRKHPGLGPSQIRNQLRRRGVKVSVTTARRVMEDAGYRPPKVKREPHDERFEAVRPNSPGYLVLAIAWTSYIGTSIALRRSR